MRVVTACSTVRDSDRSGPARLLVADGPAGLPGSTAVKLPVRPRRKTRPKAERGSFPSMHATPDDRKRKDANNLAPARRGPQRPWGAGTLVRVVVGRAATYRGRREVPST